MESITNFTYHHHHHHHLPTTFYHRRPSISKPISSLSFTTSSSLNPPFTSLKKSSFSFSSPIKASTSNSSSPTPIPKQKPSISPLKTTLIVALTATAVFFSQLNLKPDIAVSAPPPPATAESESSSDQETELVAIPDPEDDEEDNEDQSFAASAVADTVTNSQFDAKTDMEKNLEQRIRSNPNDVEALRNLMEIKLKGKKLKEAIVLINKLLTLEPNDKEWPILKAYLHTYTGDHKASMKTFNGIISKDPFRIEAYHGLIMVASQKDSKKDLIKAEEKIKEAFEKAKQLKKKSSVREFNVLLAQILVIKGDYDNALKIYKDLIKEEPRDFRPYLCQGIIYTLLKKDVDAEVSFEKYRRLVPKGHPYGEYFEENMKAAKLFVQEENMKQYSGR